MRGLRIGPLAAQHVPNTLDGLPVRGGKDTVPARPAGRHLRHGRRVQLKERGRRIIAQQQRHHVIGEPALPVPVDVTGTQTLPVAGIAHVQSHADDHFRRPPRIARLPDGLWHRHHVPLLVPDVQGLAAVFLFPGLGALQQTHQMRHDSLVRAVQAGMVTVRGRPQRPVDFTLHDAFRAAVTAHDVLEPVGLAALPFDGVDGGKAPVQIVAQGIPATGVVGLHAAHGCRRLIGDGLHTGTQALLAGAALLTPGMHQEIQQIAHLLHLQRTQRLPVQRHAAPGCCWIRICQIQQPVREQGHEVDGFRIVHALLHKIAQLHIAGLGIPGLLRRGQAKGGHKLADGFRLGRRIRPRLDAGRLARLLLHGVHQLADLAHFLHHGKGEARPLHGSHGFNRFATLHGMGTLVEGPAQGGHEALRIELGHSHVRHFPAGKVPVVPLGQALLLHAPRRGLLVLRLPVFAQPAHGLFHCLKVLTVGIAGQQTVLGRYGTVLLRQGLFRLTCRQLVHAAVLHDDGVIDQVRQSVGITVRQGVLHGQRIDRIPPPSGIHQPGHLSGDVLYHVFAQVFHEGIPVDAACAGFAVRQGLVPAGHFPDERPERRGLQTLLRLRERRTIPFATLPGHGPVHPGRHFGFGPVAQVFKLPALRGSQTGIRKELLFQLKGGPQRRIVADLFIRRQQTVEHAAHVVVEVSANILAPAGIQIFQPAHHAGEHAVQLLHRGPAFPKILFKATCRVFLYLAPLFCGQVAVFSHAGKASQGRHIPPGLRQTIQMTHIAGQHPLHGQQLASALRVLLACSGDVLTHGGTVSSPSGSRGSVTQTGLAVFQGRQLFTDIPQHGPGPFGVHLTGQDGGKGRRIAPGLLKIGPKTITGDTAVIRRHAPQIIHEDMGRLMRDGRHVRALEDTDGRRPGIQLDLGAIFSGGIRLEQYLSRPVIDPQASPKYIHHITLVREKL